MSEVSVYHAGSLFNVAERAHNTRIEKEVVLAGANKGLDVKMTLPQRRALQRFDAKKGIFDVGGIVYDCEQDSVNHDFILANIDGARADDGTSNEIGLARGQQIAREGAANPRGIKAPEIIVYRTDFRTAPDREVGVNAMLRPKGSRYIYHPCFAVEDKDFDSYYKELAGLIINEIRAYLDEPADFSFLHS